MNLTIPLSILCAMSWGVQAIFLKIAMREMPLYAAILITMILNSLIVFSFIGVSTEQGFLQFYSLSKSTYLYFMIAGVLNYFLGRGLYYSALRFIGVAQATSISSTYPILSVAFAVVFLGESLAARQYIGVGLTLFGVYVLVLKGKR